MRPENKASVPMPMIEMTPPSVFPATVSGTSENRCGYALNFDENIKILHVDRLDGFQDDRRDIDDDQPGEGGVENSSRRRPFRCMRRIVVEYHSQAATQRRHAAFGHAASSPSPGDQPRQGG